MTAPLWLYLCMVLYQPATYYKYKYKYKYPATLLLFLKCTQIAAAPPHTWRWAKTAQNFEDALRHWQIKWINWREVFNRLYSIHQ